MKITFKLKIIKKKIQLLVIQIHLNFKDDNNIHREIGNLNDKKEYHPNNKVNEENNTKNKNKV